MRGLHARERVALERQARRRDVRRAEALSLDKAIAGNTPDDINKRLGVIVENSGQSTLRRELAMELRTRTGLGTMPPPHECVALLTLRTI